MCEKVCLAGAITYDDKPKEIELETGAVILAMGNEAFDPTPLDTFGYTRLANVVTSLEFERILSATGPFQGVLQRPLDLKLPRKVAWLQCVGSRDDNRCNGYCSSVCCMYAVKEAVIAKEHSDHDLDTAIFFMDMRTYGKDFEKYYERAREEEGVRFIRSRIHSLEEDPETQDIIVQYVDEAGKVKVENFDMVVLSVGLQTPSELVDMAEELDVDLDADNFVQTGNFTPVATSRKGIYVCGTFQEPKDIPASVMEASAAACEAKEILSDVRGTLVKEKTYPEERDISSEEPRIGIFVCNCGINIGGIVDVPRVVEYARTLPGVIHVEDNLFTCSQDTQEQLKNVIQEQRLNRIVVASCTPRTHEAMFQETLRDAGLNKYLFEMANIRNQCSWVHSKEKQKATVKAMDLVRMAAARAHFLQSLSQPVISVNGSALVIGGGLSGMSAALSLADQGFPAYIIEQSDKLGGNALNLVDTWLGEDIDENVRKLTDSVESHPMIDVFTNASIKETAGFVGNYETTITQDGSDRVLKHGAVVVAVGAKEYKPTEYLYGADERVMTHLELDNAFKSGDKRVSNAGTVVFIQCVGSREPDRPYCSRVCCTHTVKSALKLKDMNPETEVYVLYRDIRTYGQREALYKEARNRGVIFIRYSLAEKPRVEDAGTGLSVTVRDHILGLNIAINPDLLVLAAGIVPHDNEPLAQMFKLSLNEDGFFMEAHAKLRPVEFATDGVFMAGMAHYPKPIEESIAQSKAAASRASVVLSKETLTVEGVVSHVDSILCWGCGRCEKACPYGAIGPVEQEDGTRVSQVREALCKGCGACAVACPTGAATLFHYNDQEVLTMVETAFEQVI